MLDRITFSRRTFAAFTMIALSGCATWDVPQKSAATSEARPQMQAASKPNPIDQIRALSGTWVATAAPENGQNPMSLVFKPTACGSAMMESMFPGTDEEMVNMFTEDGRGLLMTHYCRMGNQPRM